MATRLSLWSAVLLTIASLSLATSVSAKSPAEVAMGKASAPTPSPLSTVNLCGTIAASTTWSRTNVYVVTCDVTINAGVTVTVESGTIVKLGGGTGINVNGTLNAAGTSVQPIIFTSLKDDSASAGGDTNGDGTATTPAAGDWRAISFGGGSSGQLSWTTFAWGGAGYYFYYGSDGAIRISSSNLVLDHSTIRNSATNGIYSGAASPTITNSTFTGNLRALYVYRDFDPAVPFLFENNDIDALGAAGGLIALDVFTKAFGTATFRNNRATGNHSGIVIRGPLKGDVVWDNGAAFPLLVDSGASIDAGKTLTLAPGTIVKLADGGIDVNGTLDAQGTSVAPIVFTSFKDDSLGGDTNGDGTSTSPAAGNWRAISFGGTGHGQIAWTTFAWGGAGYYFYYGSDGMIRISSSDVVLDHTTIRNSATNGIYSGAASPTITNNTFTGNQRALYVYRDFDPVLPFLFENNDIDALGAAGGLIALDVFTKTFGTATFRNNRATGNHSGMVLRGPIPGDIVWDNGSSFPLLVDSGFTVNAGKTLSLAPGTIVKLTGGGNVGIDVNGALDAPGTSAAPIVFTSFKDDSAGGDTNGDAAATSAAAGDWRAISFGVTGHGRVSYATFAYGGAGYYYYYGSNAAVRCWSSDVTFDRVTIRDSANKAIHASNSGMQVRNGTITTATYGIQNSSSAKVIDARFNYWGDPTGPYHPTKNPAGKGLSVSDYVNIFPWAENPEGTLIKAAQVYVEGPSRVSPGQTVDYVVHYGVSQAVANAVVVATLPLSADYVESSGGAIGMPDTNQIFWKLGALDALDEGSFYVRVRYLWGIPAGFDDGFSALLGSAGLDTGVNTFDVGRYLNFTPLASTPRTTLTDGEITSALGASSKLKSLYDAAIADGFKRLGGSRLQIGGQDTLTITLGNGTADAKIELRRNLADGSIFSLFRDGSHITIDDGAGQFDWNLDLDDMQNSGGFAKGALDAQITPDALFKELSHRITFNEWSTPVFDIDATGVTKGVAFRNCMLQAMGMWAIQKFSKTVDAALKAKDCTKALALGDPDAASACFLALDKVKDTIPGVGEMAAIHQCYWDVVIGNQLDKYACNGPLVRVEPPSIGFNPVSWTEGGRRRMYVRYTCNDTNKMWGLPETLYCPPGFVAQDGALDEFNRPCVPANDDVAFAYGLDNRKVASGNKKTIVARAKDPNEKRGAIGDVLPGQLLNYTIEYENVGTGIAYGVFIVDTLSEHLDDATLVVGTGGEYIKGSRSLFWSVGDLPPNGQAGSKGTVTFSVNVKAGLASGTIITNQATVHFPSVPEETATNSVVNVVNTLVATGAQLSATAGQALPIVLQGAEAGGAPLTYELVDLPLNGTMTGTPPNVNYTAFAGFTGTDHFTFRVKNGGLASRTADVTIEVTMPPGDVTSPTLAWSDPAASESLLVNAKSQLTDTTGAVYLPFIRFALSEIADGTTLTAANVVVTGPKGVVNRTVSYDTQTGEAIVTLRDAWLPGTYTVTLSTGVKDLAGNPLSPAASWTFSTTLAGVHGDINGDGGVSVADVFFLVNYIFTGGTAPYAPADANGDGVVSAPDVFYLINYLFAGGTGPK